MPRASARSSAGVSAPGGLAQGLLGHAPCLIRGDASEASEGDALVGGLASAFSRAVVDDEGLGPRGLDPDSEAREPVVPGDEGAVGGFKGLDGAFGQGGLDPGGAFCGGGIHGAIMTRRTKSSTPYSTPGKELGARTGVRMTGQRLGISSPSLYL